jgi:hypothetical protein
LIRIHFHNSDTLFEDGGVHGRDIYSGIGDRKIPLEAIDIEILLVI